jgi:hypothetical protein|tara:strand:+ start:302 stop:514 length:213 start_codon:yes stop_codon:yes gene_type:complete
MKIGDLVKITRASIGIPSGSIALIVDEYAINYGDPSEESVFILELLNPEKKIWQVRRMARDLEIVNNATR